MAHNERRNAARVRREQLEMVEAIFRHAITSFVLLDRDRGFLRVNEAFAKRFGLGAADFPGARVR